MRLSALSEDRGPKVDEYYFDSKGNLRLRGAATIKPNEPKTKDKLAVELETFRNLATIHTPVAMRGEMIHASNLPNAIPFSRR